MIIYLFNVFKNREIQNICLYYLLFNSFNSSCKNFRIENIFLNISNILIYLIVVLVFLSFFKSFNRIKEYINENKFACFILLITFLIFLFNLFSFIVINKNYLSDLRFIFSNFLTVFLCFYFFIFLKNEKFQIFSNGKAIRLYSFRFDYVYDYSNQFSNF